MAIQPALATGMVVGLVQQVIRLATARKPDDSDDPRLLFAQGFAIAWRGILAAIMAACVLAQLLIAKRLWQEPTGEEALIVPVELSLYLILQIVILVVLCDSVRRWRRATADRETSTHQIVVTSIAALILLVLMMPHFGIIHYLVHIATAGIEVDHPLRFQRVGAFPDHRQEGFRLFWITISALVLLSLSAVCLIAANRARRKTARLIAILGLVLTLSTAALFVAWFYGREFHRISPDLAAVGLAGIWFDRFKGMTILAILITAGAYRLSTRSEPVRLIRQNMNDPAIEPVFHESVIGLCLFGAAAGLDVFFFVKVLASFSPGLQRTIWEFLGTLFTYPYTYLLLGFLLLGGRLCWIRFRRRNDMVPWKLFALDKRRFLWNWIGLAFLASVGLPVLSIYCFVYWLGPWYLYGPK